jgi:hypothetical protein
MGSPSTFQVKLTWKVANDNEQKEEIFWASW